MNSDILLKLMARLNQLSCAFDFLTLYLLSKQLIPNIRIGFELKLADINYKISLKLIAIFKR